MTDDYQFHFHDGLIQRAAASGEARAPGESAERGRCLLILLCLASLAYENKLVNCSERSVIRRYPKMSIALFYLSAILHAFAIF